MATKRNISWNEFLMDSDGEFSFKRIFTAVFSLLFIALFWINLFTGKMINERLLDTIEVVILTSIGTIALEMFMKKRTTTVVTQKGMVSQTANPLQNTAMTDSVEKIVQDTAEEMIPKGKEV
jgi:hypothetical protein